MSGRLDYRGEDRAIMLRRVTPYLVHFGYALMLCALVARDILWLRSILICAQSLLALYGWRIGIPSIVAWNSAFVAINVVWVILILRERRAVSLPAELGRLHESYFSALTPPEFLRLWRDGQRETLNDDRLTREGAFPESLFFLLSGTVRVSHASDHVRDLEAGCFIGEMSVITGEPATADAVAVGTASVMRWPAERLHAVQQRDPVLWTKVQSVIGQDLVRKLGATRR